MSACRAHVARAVSCHCRPDKVLLVGTLAVVHLKPGSASRNPVNTPKSTPPPPPSLAVTVGSRWQVLNARDGCHRGGQHGRGAAGNLRGELGKTTMKLLTESSSLNSTPYPVSWMSAHCT